MNALLLVAAVVLTQAKVPDQPSPNIAAQNYTIDQMTTAQQKEWLLAHLIVDLHFNEDKIVIWDKKLDAMSPSMVAVTIKAYVLSQEKKQLQEEKSHAMKMAKIQAQGQTYWNRYYYKYRSYSYNNYSRPNYGYGYGFPTSYGYPIYPFRLR